MVFYIIHKPGSITIQVRLKVRFFISKIVIAVIERHHIHCQIKRKQKKPHIYLVCNKEVTHDIKQVVNDNDWGFKYLCL